MFPEFRGPTYPGYEQDDIPPKQGKRPGWQFPIWKGLTGGDGYLIRADTNKDNWYSQTEYHNLQQQKGKQFQDDLLNQGWAKAFWNWMGGQNKREQEAQGGTSYFPHYSPKQKGGGKGKGMASMAYQPPPPQQQAVPRRKAKSGPRGYDGYKYRGGRSVDFSKMKPYKRQARSPGGNPGGGGR